MNLREVSTRISRLKAAGKCSKMEISPEEFYKIGPAARQRNHHERAKDYQRKGMVEWLPGMEVVAIGILDGKWYRVDGNTRITQIVELKSLKVPTDLKLCAHIIDCGTDKEDLEATRLLFNNNNSAIKSKDRYAGARRESGFDPRSSLMKGSVSKAFEIGGRLVGVSNATDIYAQVDALQEAAETIDDMNLASRSVPFTLLGVAMAFYYIADRRGVALEFVENYGRGLGEKSGGAMDSIEALSKRVPAHGSSDIPEAVAYTIMALEAYRAGTKFTGRKGLTMSAKMKRLIEEKNFTSKMHEIWQHYNSGSDY
jgi:hypothetical protein